MDVNKLYEEFPILQKMREGQEVVWINPDKKPFAEVQSSEELTMDDINDAEARLLRFAPFIQRCFPETAKNKGIIESNLTDIPAMQELAARKYGSALPGRLLLKQDNDLPIAGSVKARGGIYEVLKHAEDLALEHGIVRLSDDYAKLAEPKFRDFFSDYTIQVGSTGNLGMSIGIMGAAFGFQVIVHMSADARKWKKDLLRSHGVQVIEYQSDYGEAVKNGRERSNENPKSYFVDDENSRTLFLGYAVAAKRLEVQLRKKGICVDKNHPLFVFIPCGVGGAPGGISFGLKQIFGDDVHCFFSEPVQAPCMLLGLVSGLNNQISVQDIGLTGRTQADGLAVSRPSSFVGKVMKPLLSGEFTVSDSALYDYMRDLMDSESIFLEPSACAAFQGLIRFSSSEEMERYLKKNNLQHMQDSASYIAWATGGSLVPDDIRREYQKTFIK